MKKREITNTDQTVNGNKHSRRNFIKTAAVGGLSVGSLFNVDRVAYATQKVNKNSRQMKLRNNRNLYNGDFGEDITIYGVTELMFNELNGPSGHNLSKYQAYNYRFDVSQIIEGWNEIIVSNGDNNSIKIVSLEFAIKRT